jgi:hypothetical protein
LKPTSTGLPLSPSSTPQTVNTTPQASDGRSTSFRAVEGGNEMQSGEKLLVEAYAAIWVLLFVMLLLWWRRQRKIDERVSFLEAAVMKARAEAASASKASKAARAKPPVAEAQEARDA